MEITYKNMKKYWETKDGEEIEYKKLKDDHLLNILKWVKSKAKNGLSGTRKVYIDIGYDGDSYIPDFIYVNEIFYDNEVKDFFDYKGLLKEAKIRKLKV